MAQVMEPQVVYTQCITGTLERSTHRVWVEGEDEWFVAGLRSRNSEGITE